MADPAIDYRRRLDAIFSEALTLAGPARIGFLERTCGDDPMLRRDVEALLTYHDEADIFLERPALHDLADIVAEDMRSRVGSEIDGYRIDTLIGSGGMGDVYLARDLKLNRDVAIKVFERSAAYRNADVRRVEEEARTASQLNHPNIVTIHAVGETDAVAYIAMELVRGRTLRELMAAAPMSTTGVLDILNQIADALTVAHARGIVHRDLKPENVMVTADGLVKVLDFGIAKGHHLRGVDGRDSRFPQEPDAPGVILGTAAYMSPEQAAGQAVDYRSDQFSFGAVAYELLSGRRAFARPSSVETLAAIQHERPEPLPLLRDRTSRALQEVVARCLAKAPEGRFSTTDDLAARLRQIRRQQGPLTLTRRQVVTLAAAVVGAGAVGAAGLWHGLTGPRFRRLAVIPFANADRDEGTAYLCEGLADSLIRRLSLVPTLQVKALGAVRPFQDAVMDARTIGRQLEADAILTGSVTRRAGRLLVSAELTDVDQATRLWGSRFDRPLADVLAVHDEVASAIIRDVLGVELRGEDERRFARALTTSPRAYDVYLQGVHHFRLQTRDDYLAARGLLAQAVADDPSFALAHVTLASTYSVMAIDSYEPPATCWPASIAHVERALSIDPDLPDAHAEKSSVEFFHRRHWDSADREWQMALSSQRGEVQPELLTLRSIQKWALGDKTEALRFARDARRADPLSLLCAVRECDMLLHNGQLDAAASGYERLMREAPDDLRAPLGLAEVRRRQGRFDEAIAIRRQLQGDDPVVDDDVRGAAGYARLERDELLLQLQQMRAAAAEGLYISPLDYAQVYARLNDRAQTLDFLQRAVHEGTAGLVFLRVAPAWDSVRHEAKFQDVVAALGFPDQL